MGTPKRKAGVFATDQAVELAKQLEPLASILKENPTAKLARDLAPISKMLEDSAVAKLGKHFAGFDFAGAEALAGISGAMDEHRKALERIRPVFPAGIKSPQYESIADILPGPPETPNLRIPPNPIHKTNQHLATLTEKIEALSNVQAEQAHLIDLLLQAQIASAKGQDRMARKQYFVAIGSILIAVIAVMLNVL
jgi:hypothetical protein